MSSPSTAARIGAVAFAVLAVATGAAFFVAQRLKSAPAVILDPKATPFFSPNGDKAKDVARISFGLKEDDTITVEIIDDKGDVVRTVAGDDSVRRYRTLHYRWNGNDDSRRRVINGVYRVRVTLRNRGRTLTLGTPIVLDTIPPHPRVIAAGTGPQILPRPDGRAAVVGLRAPGKRLHVMVFRTAGDPAHPPARILRQRLPRRTRTFTWNGTAGAPARPAPAGTYVVVAEVTDRAGNVGTSVPLGIGGLPFAGYGERFPGRGGVTVRYLGVQPPTLPVAAGRRATFGIDARGGDYAWTLRRVARAPIRKGGGATPILRVRAPKGDAALDVLRVTTAKRPRRVASSPLAVQSAATHKVLVVLPFLSWQGRNPVDDDGDGRPNTLTAGLPVRLGRVFAGDGLPTGFAGQEAPLVAALDRAGRRYDITTDVALEAGVGPTLKGHTGVLLAGSARWLPNRLSRRLSRFVRDGGNLASFGIGALRRFATVSPQGEARDPTQPTDTDLFGAPPVRVQTAPAKLTVGEDRISLFSGTSGEFGPFVGVEPFADPAVKGEGGPVLASAVIGGDAGRPVILATRVGKGVVVRFPIPGMAARLASDTELTQLLRNTWILLSR